VDATNFTLTFSIMDSYRRTSQVNECYILCYARTIYFLQSSYHSHNSLQINCKNVLHILVNLMPRSLSRLWLTTLFSSHGILVADHDKEVTNMTELLKRNRGVMPLTVTFSNIAMDVQMYLTIPMNNCQDERSFSTLQRVKNHLLRAPCIRTD